MNLSTTKRSNSVLRLYFSIFILLFMLTGVTSLHAEEKKLQVRTNKNELDIVLEPKKQSYKVNESIDFTIRGNKTFFLYLYTINHELNRAVLLIPGQVQKGNKYKANTTYTLPNKDFEFYGDRPGVEDIVAFASTVYLDVDVNGYIKKEGFLTTTPEKADNQLKALGIRSKQKKAEYAVKHLKLNIKDNALNSALSDQYAPVVKRENNRPIIVLNSDARNYRTGDPVRIAYGADQDGWLFLYSYEANGKTSLLKKTNVTKNQLYSLKLMAVEPKGDQALIALFEKKQQKSFQKKSISDLFTENALDEKQGKGLQLAPNEPSLPVHAVVKITIK